MKTYKHKKLGRKADGYVDNDNKLCAYEIKNPEYGIQKVSIDYIEDSLDRQEVVEKDWIEKVLDGFEMCDYYEIRDGLRHNMPKVSIEEIKEINKSDGTDINGNLIFHIDKNDLIELLKDKGLLSDK